MRPALPQYSAAGQWDSPSYRSNEAYGDDLYAAAEQEEEEARGALGWAGATLRRAGDDARGRPGGWLGAVMMHGSSDEALVEWAATPSPLPPLVRELAPDGDAAQEGVEYEGRPGADGGAEGEPPPPHTSY
jgi:hypothetical protein